MIDQFVRKDGSNYDGTSSYYNNMVDQVEWVDDMVSSKPDDYHAFVLAHKNLIGGNHKDNLFGSNLTSNADSRDAFIKSLDTNNVGAYISGLTTCITGLWFQRTATMATIKSSSSSPPPTPDKFYTPWDEDDGRETMLQRNCTP